MTGPARVGSEDNRCTIWSNQEVRSCTIIGLNDLEYHLLACCTVQASGGSKVEMLFWQKIFAYERLNKMNENG